MERFIPKKYTSFYDNNFREHFLWGVWDNETNSWSNYLCHGEYKTKREAIKSIKFANAFVFMNRR